MDYGVEIKVDDTTTLVEKTDTVLDCTHEPRYQEQITPLLGGDSPFVKDRDNVLSSITFIVQKEHDSVDAALEYQLNIVGQTPRQGDVAIAIDSGGNPTSYTMENDLIRVTTGNWYGILTTTRFTFIGPAPNIPPPEEE